MENLYYEVALPLPLRKTFTYSSNIKISNGSRVKVPFRNREIVGYVLRKQSSPNVKSIKSINSINSNIMKNLSPESLGTAAM